MREYELMYIVRPELDDEALQAAVDSVATLVAAQGGTVLKTTMWGKRRLAYEVQRLRDGHYVILRLSLDTAKVAPFERALHMHDAVFRHLLVSEDGVRPVETGTDSTASVAATAHPAPASVPDDDDATDDQPVPVAPGAEHEEEN